MDKVGFVAVEEVVGPDVYGVERRVDGAWWEERGRLVWEKRL